MAENNSKFDIEDFGVTAVLVVFSFYPFNFLLLVNHKKGVASALEKILQWPFYGQDFRLCRHESLNTRRSQFIPQVIAE